MNILYTHKIENYKNTGFDIVFNALVEDHQPDWFETEKEEKEFYKELDNFDSVYFCAEIKAVKGNINFDSEYLGCCHYKTYDEFYKIKDCYFDDMCETAIETAKEQIKELINSLK